MITQFRSCRSTMQDRRITVQQPDAGWKPHAWLAREKLLQDSLLMFLDLGLSPLEISRSSGFSLADIKEGLRRLEEGSQAPMAW